MFAMKHFVIGAAFALAGTAIGSQACAAAEAVENPSISKLKSTFTMRTQPTDSASQWAIASGWIPDVRAFYAEWGIELSEATLKGEPNHAPPTIPPPKPGAGTSKDDSPSKVGDLVDTMTYSIVIGKWHRLTRYYRKASGADQSIATAPWQLIRDTVAYGSEDCSVNRPELCSDPPEK